jgi:hypothetical protein
VLLPQDVTGKVICLDRSNCEIVLEELEALVLALLVSTELSVIIQFALVALELDTHAKPMLPEIPLFALANARMEELATLLELALVQLDGVEPLVVKQNFTDSINT